jgi:pyridoxal phosphate enzyme (YggS family)
MMNSRAQIVAQISAALTSVARPSAAAELLAVSKGQSAEAVAELIAEGQRAFGENRVQEAEAKFGDLRQGHPDLRLHLIGPLQTNKVKAALDLFTVIETVDRPSLVEALGKECAKRGRQPELFIEVNTGEEAQKSGVLPADLSALLELCAKAGLKISGLMCIPPVDDEACLHFAFLAELARRHNLDKLSMGMSSDFGMALRYGSTEVRIGTALFGSRDETQSDSREAVRL